MKTFSEQPTSTALPDNVKQIFSAQDPESYENMYNVYFNSIVHLKELRKPDNKKAFLPLESVQFPLELLKEHFTPKPLPKPAKTVFEALKPAFGNDPMRPAMQGLAVCGGYAYATDAHIMVKYRTGEKQNYHVDKAGIKTQVTKKEERYISTFGALPQYDTVIPLSEHAESSGKIDIREVYPGIAAIAEWSKSVFCTLKSPFATNAIAIFEGKAYSVILLSRLFEVFLKLGEHNLYVYHHSGNRALSFETDGLKPKLTGLVMPIYLEKALNMPYINL